MSVKLIESQSPDGIRDRLLQNQQARRIARAKGDVRVVYAPLQYPSFKLPPIKVERDQPASKNNIDTSSDRTSIRFSKRTHRLPKRSSLVIHMNPSKLKKMLAEQAIEKRMHGLGFANYLSTKRRKNHHSADSLRQSKLTGHNELQNHSATVESLAKLSISRILPPLDINFKAIRKSELLESKIMFEKLKNPNEKDLALKKKLNKAVVGPREILSVAPRKESPRFKPPRRTIFTVSNNSGKRITNP
ncbi:hypothetical protein HDV04_000907 [Boothiomyces sp. JEL0838]|nr:hypothetical protein HDV04_000858 [Boothiomyces sp. JEL0838]KAJ3314184.1 hypothetical protein HDV04_000907 [Boothiomyces sp. JEL0838]